MYEIIGTDRRYGMRQNYGTFKSLKDCLTHMDFLRRSFGSIVKFKYVEVMNYERNYPEQSLGC